MEDLPELTIEKLFTQPIQKPFSYDLKLGQNEEQTHENTFEHVKNYFNSLPIKKIIFVINYKKNQDYYESKLNDSVSQIDITNTVIPETNSMDITSEVVN